MMPCCKYVFWNYYDWKSVPLLTRCLPLHGEWMYPMQTNSSICQQTPPDRCFCIISVRR